MTAILQETSAPSGLFEGTARYYRRFRPDYPAEVINFLRDRFDLGFSSAVLDLGTGTGKLAIPLAECGCNVFAVDPSVEMLAEGLAAANDLAVQGIWWQIGSDRNVSALKLPDLRLCTMGASFHWMDRPRILLDLYPRLSSGGGVAILGGGINTWREDQDDWNGVVQQTVRDFLGEERRAGQGTYSHPERKHEEVVADSPFADVRRDSFSIEAEMTAEDIFGLQLSTSYASPRLLGNQIDAFREVLIGRLRELSPSGHFRFTRTFEVISAKRR